MKIEEAYQNRTKLEPLKLRIKSEDEVYVDERLKKDVEGVICNMQNPEKFGPEMGYNGVLFKGPAGTGKTLYAQLLALKTDADFIDVGVVSSPDQVRDLYAEARKRREEAQKKGASKPIILF